MPLWLYVALAAPTALFGNVGSVALVVAAANLSESKPRPPRGGKRIPLPLPVGA